jgi:hypothetical protein
MHIPFLNLPFVVPMFWVITDALLYGDVAAPSAAKLHAGQSAQDSAEASLDVADQERSSTPTRARSPHARADSSVATQGRSLQTAAPAAALASSSAARGGLGGRPTSSCVPPASTLEVGAVLEEGPASPIPSSKGTTISNAGVQTPTRRSTRHGVAATA